MPISLSSHSAILSFAGHTTPDSPTLFNFAPPVNLEEYADKLYSTAIHLKLSALLGLRVHSVTVFHSIPLRLNPSRQNLYVDTVTKDGKLYASLYNYKVPLHEFFRISYFKDALPALKDSFSRSVDDNLVWSRWLDHLHLSYLPSTYIAL